MKQEISKNKEIKSKKYVSCEELKPINVFAVLSTCRISLVCMDCLPRVWEGW